MANHAGNWKFAAQQQSAARTFSFVQHVGGAAAARTFPVSHSTVTFGVEVAGRRNSGARGMLRAALDFSVNGGVGM